MRRPVERGRFQECVGLFVIPIFFSVTQAWASFRVIAQIKPGPIYDGVHYITQAQGFQSLHVSRYIHLEHLVEYGLYPAFLSLFDFSNLTDWSTASTHPQVLAVGAAQTLLLSASTALFMLLAYRLIPGNALRRVASSLLMGALLFSPFVVVWPTRILTEAVTVSALLMFVAACLAYDAERNFSLVLVGLSACLLVAIRDPMIFFIWIFALLLGANILFARTQARYMAAAGLVVLLLAAGLGYGRASALQHSGKYLQTFVNIIQFRILPDPQRRAFFAERGLVLSPTVMERSGKPAWFNNTLFERDDQLSADFLAYRNWVTVNGIRTYATFLVQHPGYVVRSLFASPNISSPNECGPDFLFSFADIFSTPMTGYWIETVPHPLWLKNLLLAPVGWLAVVLYLIVVAARYVSRTFKRQRASALETMAIAAGIGLFVSYHTDACDPWRHTFPFALMIYLSMIVRVVDVGKDLMRLVRIRWARGDGWSADREAAQAHD